MSERAIKNTVFSLNKTSHFIYLFISPRPIFSPAECSQFCAVVKHFSIYYVRTCVSDGISKDIKQNTELSNPGNIFINQNYTSLASSSDSLYWLTRFQFCIFMKWLLNVHLNLQHDVTLSLFLFICTDCVASHPLQEGWMQVGRERPRGKSASWFELFHEMSAFCHRNDILHVLSLSFYSFFGWGWRCGD